MSVQGGPSGPPHSPVPSDSEIFRKYYSEHDALVSPEGILKVISVIACIACSVLFLSGRSCSGAPWVVASAAATALAAAAAVALLTAGLALGAPLYAPLTWLYMDIIVCTVCGVLLLVAGLLGLALCPPAGARDLLPGALAIATAAAVVASAAITYASAMRLREGIAGAARRPPAPPSRELEV